jgi:hypothetical protein
VLIHDTLDQYTQIIEAIDTVVDDALAHKRAVTTLAEVAKTEKGLLTKLQKFSEIASNDSERYRFSLDQAIDTTKDSADASEVDIGTRAKEVEAKETQVEKEREESSARDAKAPKPDEDKTASKGDTSTKKKASLLRPGESLKKGEVLQVDTSQGDTKKQN